MSTPFDSKQPLPVDPVLAGLMKALRVADDHFDGRFPSHVTLSVRGCIVTGKLVSFREWSRHHEIIEQVVEHLQADKNLPMEFADRDYIHLANAHIVAPGMQAFPNQKEGLSWRVRIDSVDAFTVVPIVLADAPATSPDR